MPEDQDLQAADLIMKYLRNGLKEDELQELEQWKKSGDNNMFFDKVISQAWMLQELQVFDSLNDDMLWQKIAAGLPSRSTLAPINKNRGWWRYAAVASVLMVISAGAYFWVKNFPAKETAKTETPTKKYDIAPGREGAILTLADGKQIVLDTAANGSLTEQGSVQVIKMDGSVSYDADSRTDLDASPIYNTISTPKGRTFRVILADGSTIWLNAGSSVYFPTAFSGKERRVAITGEGYFEIAKNAVPFIVSVKGVEVKVLGTHFNVNAYDDESTVKTTLLEGSVQIKKGILTEILKPGQQAQITNTIQLVNGVNTDQEIAWKDGYFKFNSTDLKTVMRQLARWYDIEVVFSDNMPTILYNGRVPRNINISEMLKVLEDIGGHFKVEGKKVIVLP